MLSELLSDLRYRLRALFRRGAMERELDDELQFHLDREAEKYVRAGMSPGEARRRARLAFGGVAETKEESRDARGLVLLQVLSQDLRYALRSLRANPGFTAAVVLTLGLGLGANAAMFGIVDRLLFRPPPFLRDPARVHRVYLAWNSRGTERAESAMEYTRYLDLARWTTAFSQVTAFHYSTLAVGIGQDAREMAVGTLSATFFGFFDARPVIGRFFTASEDTVPRGAAVTVLSYGFWQSRYGGRADVLGKSLQIGPLMYTIIGVAPEGFVGTGDGEAPAAFIPITTYAGTVGFSRDPSDYYTAYHWGWMEMLVRRKPGVSVVAATADLTTAYLRSYEAERAISPHTTPAEIARPHALAAPVLNQGGPNQSTVTKVAKWISGVAAVVLLIACANVANLLLARALRRRREIAVRLALGVGRGRLLSQLLTESLLLAAAGSVAGLLVASWGGGAVLGALFLQGAAEADTVVNWRTLGFAAAAALLAGLLTGLAPVLQARRADVVGALKAGAREGTYQRSRTRSLLLLLQGALSVVLLVGAGLFVRSLQNVRSLRLGYDVEPVLYVHGNLRGEKLSDGERAALARRLQEAVKTVPGVEEASLGVTVPFWNHWSTGLFVPGIDSVERLGQFTLQAGSPEYFRTLGTRIVRGRGISPQDRRGAPGALVVSEAMAQVLWPGKDAIGQCVKVEADTVPCSTVVGIAENIKQRSISDDRGLHYYLAVEQFHPESADLFVRVRGAATQHAETVRRELQRLMPGASYVSATPMRDIVNPNLRSWQLGATMFLAFGALALVLAAVGLYSVIAYNVAQRTHELGLRIALGARVGDVLRLVVGEGVRFAVLGILIGGAIALWAGRWVRPLLFAESPTDPVVFGAVTGVLLTVAAAASVGPAMRASRVDPNVALRAE